MRSLKLKKIKEELKKLEPELREKFQVKRIALFGSYLRDEQRTNSDLDILVEFSDPVGLFCFVELEEFLSKNLRIKVDLVMKDALKLRIKDVITKQALYV